HAAAKRRQPDVELVARLRRRAVHHDGDLRPGRDHRHYAETRADHAGRADAPPRAALFARSGPWCDRVVRLDRAGGAVVLFHDWPGARQAPRAVRPAARHSERLAVADLSGVPTGRRLLACLRVEAVQACLGRPDGNRSTRRIAVSPPALSLTGVTKKFGQTEIIRGVSMNVAAGERHALIGPNGAGKTTLFNLISGRFPLTSGEIRL